MSTTTDWQRIAAAAAARIRVRTDAWDDVNDRSTPLIAWRGIAALVRTAHPSAVYLHLGGIETCDLVLADGTLISFDPATLPDPDLWVQMLSVFYDMLFVDPDRGAIRPPMAEAAVLVALEAGFVTVEAPEKAQRWIDLDAAVVGPEERAPHERALTIVTAYAGLYATDDQILAWDEGFPSREWWRAVSALMHSLVSDVWSLHRSHNPRLFRRPPSAQRRSL